MGSSYLLRAGGSAVHPDLVRSRTAWRIITEVLAELRLLTRLFLMKISKLQ